MNLSTVSVPPSSKQHRKVIPLHKLFTTCIQGRWSVIFQDALEANKFGIHIKKELACSTTIYRYWYILYYVVVPSESSLAWAEEWMLNTVDEKRMSEYHNRMNPISRDNPTLLQHQKAIFRTVAEILPTAAQSSVGSEETESLKAEKEIRGSRCYVTDVRILLKFFD